MANLGPLLSGLTIGITLFSNVAKHAVEAWVIQDLYPANTDDDGDAKFKRASLAFGATFLVYMFLAVTILAFWPNGLGRSIKFIHKPFVVAMALLYLLQVASIYRFREGLTVPPHAPIEQKIVTEKANSEARLLVLGFLVGSLFFSASDDQELARVWFGLLIGGVIGTIVGHFATRPLKRLYGTKYKTSSHSLKPETRVCISITISQQTKPDYVSPCAENQEAGRPDG